MPTRTARTAWTGSLEQGSGKVELTSSKVGTYDVSFPKRAAEDAGGTTEAAVRSVLLLPAELQPQQVISLLGLGGPSFPLANHADHIHVGY